MFSELGSYLVSNMFHNNILRRPSPQLHVLIFMHSSSWDPAADIQVGVVITWCYQSSHQHATGHRSDLQFLVWLIIFGGISGARSVTVENLEDNVLNFDLIVPMNVKAEARNSQFTRLLNLC